jgi:hypothetical protein
MKLARLYAAATPGHNRHETVESGGERRAGKYLPWNFTSLPNGAKVVLAFGMTLGRLEFFAVLVVITEEFWR